MPGLTERLFSDPRSLQILEAVRDVHAGGAPMSASIARKVVQFFGRQAAPPTGPAPSADLDRLTEREHAVLMALSEGQQYKEIAETLAISINTVRKHIKNIYEKLQVNTRLDAVRKLAAAETNRKSPAASRSRGRWTRRERRLRCLAHGPRPARADHNRS